MHRKQMILSKMEIQKTRQLSNFPSKLEEGLAAEEMVTSSHNTPIKEPKADDPFINTEISNVKQSS